MPCADGYVDLCEEKTELADRNHHEDSGTANDDCSPFCYCTCCTGYSTDHFIAEVEPAIESYQRDRFSHLSLSIKEISLPIWQPPQLSA